MSSPIDSSGGNGGIVVVGSLKVVALGVGCALESYSNRLLLQDEEDEDERGMRSCTKWGIVAINGESAHGFLGEVRFSSREGSMNLWWLWQPFDEKCAEHLLCKSEGSAGSPGQV